MRFGVCIGPENWAAVSAVGYDYVEGAIASLLKPQQDRVEVMPVLQQTLATLPLKAETYNVLLPGVIKVVGPEVNAAVQKTYLEEAFIRAAMLGGQVAVFGSGGSRGLPEGWAYDQAWQQVKEFLTRAGEAAASHGLAVAIEPLNRGECNFINSVQEATQLAREVNHPHVGVLSDLYHVDAEGQSYEETRAAGHYLRHVHIAGAEGRQAPNEGDLTYLIPYFRVLKEMRYDGRISIEGGWKDFAAQAAEALAVMRHAWDEA